jgi:hypothetical protein
VDVPAGTLLGVLATGPFTSFGSPVFPGGASGAVVVPDGPFCEEGDTVVLGYDSEHGHPGTGFSVLPTASDGESPLAFCAIVAGP